MEVNIKTYKIFKMKTFNLIIKSKNKNSINNFITFFNKNKFDIIQKYSHKKTKKKRLTILKSPHVNKKAQEQFESRMFKKQLTIQITKSYKYLIFLKKLNYNLFPDISIKIQYRKNLKLLPLQIFYPNNFKFNKYVILKNLNVKNLNQQKQNKKLHTNLITKKTNFLLKIFDIYGQFLKLTFE